MNFLFSVTSILAVAIGPSPAYALGSTTAAVSAPPREVSKKEQQVAQDVRNLIRSLAETGLGLKSEKITYEATLKYHYLNGNLTEIVRRLREKKEALIEQGEHEGAKDVARLLDFFEKKKDDFHRFFTPQDAQRMRDSESFARGQVPKLNDFLRSIREANEQLWFPLAGLVVPPILIILDNRGTKKYHRHNPYFYVPSVDDSDPSLLHCPSVAYPVDHKKENQGRYFRTPEAFGRWDEAGLTLTIDLNQPGVTNRVTKKIGAKKIVIRASSFDVAEMRKRRFFFKRWEKRDRLEGPVLKAAEGEEKIDLNVWGFSLVERTDFARERRFRYRNTDLHLAGNWHLETYPVQLYCPTIKQFIRYGHKQADQFAESIGLK